MAGLLKKIFGGDDDEAQEVAQEAGAAAEGGATGLLDQVSDLFGGAIPDVGEIQKAVDGLSQTELQSAATGAMEQLDGSTRADFGQLLQGFLNQSGGGAQAPAGVASGDPNALGQSVSGLLKTQGLGALAGLFGGGGAAAGGSSANLFSSSGTQPGGTAAPPTIQTAGGAGGGVAGAPAGAPGAAGGLDIGALLSSPIAKAVLAALLPAILKAFQGKK
jgi:hypothetical protein